VAFEMRSLAGGRARSRARRILSGVSTLKTRARMRVWRAELGDGVKRAARTFVRVRFSPREAVRAA
jgi:hypothetical protein